MIKYVHAAAALLPIFLLSSCSKSGFDDGQPENGKGEEETTDEDVFHAFPFAFNPDSTYIVASSARMVHVHAYVSRNGDVATTAKGLKEDGVAATMLYGATADTSSFVGVDAIVSETVNDGGYSIDSYAILSGDARTCYLLLKLESKSGSVATNVLRVNVPSAPAVERQEMEAVDLGLSVLWGKTNLGAETESDTGGYYVFGEIAPRSSFQEERWAHFNVGLGVLLGSVSGVEGLDAALAACGQGWRLPTYEEMRELVDVCEWDGVSSAAGGPAMLFRGAGGATIVLPCAGVRRGRAVVHNDNFDGYDADGKFSGYYMTGTVGQEADVHCSLRFDMKSNGSESGIYVSRDSPSWMGYSVRPVRDR